MSTSFKAYKTISLIAGANLIIMFQNCSSSNFAPLTNSEFNKNNSVISLPSSLPSSGVVSGSSSGGAVSSGTSSPSDGTVIDDGVVVPQVGNLPVKCLSDLVGRSQLRNWFDDNKLVETNVSINGSNIKVVGVKENNKVKVLICQTPPGNPSNQHLISVGQSAVPQGQNEVISWAEMLALIDPLL